MNIDSLSKEAQIMAYYRHRPVKFLKEVLDVRPEHIWDKMSEIAHSVRDHQFTCVKAGNSLSKSFTVGRLALWFLYTHHPSTVVTTAPSNTQVEEILWREIASAHSNARIPLRGTMLRSMLDLQKDVGGEKWFAVGFATKPDTVTQQVTRFQGFHNEHVLIVFDEAAGILPQIWEAKDRLVTNPNVKFIAIGNPTVSRGDFVDCFKDKKYNKITISVMDTPNYKQGREVIPGLSGREFAEQIKDKYGEGSSQWKSMVTGEIPDEDADSLIPLAWIEKAEGNKNLNRKDRYLKRFVVWDVADGGNDPQVIKVYENTVEIDSQEIRGKKVEEAERYVWTMLRKHNANCIVVDGDGIGRVAVSLLDQSRDLDTTIIAFEGSSRDVKDEKMFTHVRSEACWALRDMFEKGEICISHDREQREELASLKLDLDKGRKGQIVVESKVKLKDMLSRSPGQADCHIMMAWCYDQVPIIEKLEDRYSVTSIDQEDYPFNPATC